MRTSHRQLCYEPDLQGPPIIVRSITGETYLARLTLETENPNSEAKPIQNRGGGAW